MPIKIARSKSTGVPGIFEIGPNRFLVRVWSKDLRTGKRRKTEKLAATLEEAVVEREKARRGVSRAKTELRILFDDFAERWAEENGNRVEESTKVFWSYAFAHASMAFGDVYVDALTPADFRSWRNTTAKDVAAPTFNGWLRTVRLCLDDAVEDGLIPTNPARAIKTRREGPTKGARANALSVDDFKLFVAATVLVSGERVAEDIARLILAMAWTGLRKGEVLALRWDDYRDGELLVERSVWHQHEKPTKTDDPRRVVVVEPLADVLAAQRRWLLKNSTRAWSLGSSSPRRNGMPRLVQVVEGKPK